MFSINQASLRPYSNASDFGFPDQFQEFPPIKGLLLTCVVFSVFVNLLMLTGPLFMLQVYDRVLSSRSEETLVALFLLVTLLFALMAGLDFVRGRILLRVGVGIQRTVDPHVFHAVLGNASRHKHGQKTIGDLRDVDNLRALFTSPALTAFFDLPWTPVFIAAIFVFHPLLGWLSLLGSFLLIALALTNSFVTRSKRLQAQNKTAQAELCADQTCRAVDIVRSQAMEKTMTNRWLSLREAALEPWTLASDRSGIFASLSKSLRLFLQSALLAAGAWLVLQGEMTAGAMITGSILMGRALAPVDQLIGQWGLFVRALESWRAVKVIFRRGAVEHGAFELPRPAANLKVAGVTYFGSGRTAPILETVGFSITAGQAVGVIGRSGSGKSTLARMLVGLTDPDAGEIKLGGAALTQFPDGDLGRFVGYLPQNVQLLPGTIAENISRMSETPESDRVARAARRAQAHEMILSLPDGYQTIVHASGSLLSGGQMQRIALARALFEDPVMLVLDEPNSALDNEGSEALNRVVREMKKRKGAVVIMTHRPMAIAECDRLVVLEKGKVKVDGPRDDVLRLVHSNTQSLHAVATAEGRR